MSAESTKPYEVLARRYRSRSFAEVVGQEAIASTLENAISNGRTAHAYLFCGTRGVGKTSMARIFAKAMNASGGLLGEEDAVADAILQGRDSDVIEIDAASNRGIDNARDLIAGAGIAPMRGPYRIYIIDEVHMLTPQAFNALLKTMEEPPRHVKFILCTTEPHQVPATIQSRCQRFDFRAISASRIAAHLGDVLEREGIEADPEVLSRLARMADGSMRDGLSLLDRLASGATGRLTAAELEALFGLPEDAVVDELLAAVGRGDAGAVLEAAGTLLDKGLGGEQLLEALAERLREVLVAKTCGAGSELLETAPERREELASLAEPFDPAIVVSLIALADGVGKSIRSSSAPRPLLDAALVRMALGSRFADAAGLLAGGPPPKKRLAPAAGAARVPEKRRTTADLPRVDREVAVKPMPPRPSGTSDPTSSISSNRPSANQRVDAEEAPHTPPASEPRDGPSRTPVGPETSLSDVAGPAADTPETVDAVWQRVLGGAESPRRRAMLESVAPIGFDGRTLTVRAAVADAAARWLESRPEPLLEAVRAVLGPRVAVRFEPADADVEPPAPSSEQVRSPLLEHPAVKGAIEVFEATVVHAGPAAAWSTGRGVDVADEPEGFGETDES
jgi:DNA polymerase-3 subunit gamma/tau